MNGDKTAMISVIVPVKNQEVTIRDCIEALLNQTLTPHEIIVVDGHSTDSTVPICAEYPVKVVYEEYGTVGGARQIGVEQATGEFIAFTDADCVPDREWLANLRKEFQPQVVGVGGGTKNVGEGLWERVISLALDTYLGSANSVQDRLLKTRRIVNSISGCNSMYKKRDLAIIGGFDRSLALNEDTELNCRLNKLGEIIYAPDAIVLHNQRRNLQQFARRMFLFGFGRGKLRLFAIQTIPPIFLIGVLLIIPVYLSLTLFFLGIYASVVLLYAAKISIQQKRGILFLAIPVVFVLEHITYTLGFWYGLLVSLARNRI